MQQTLQVKRNRQREMTLEEFEKMHSKPFLYILEQYERWQALKQKRAAALEVSES
jgi:hypothetical protein